MTVTPAAEVVSLETAVTTRSGETFPATHWQWLPNAPRATDDEADAMRACAERLRERGNG